jgi:predicted PurR-regulated permease PerM
LAGSFTFVKSVHSAYDIVKNVRHSPERLPWRSTKGLWFSVLSELSGTISYLLTRLGGSDVARRKIKAEGTEGGGVETLNEKTTEQQDQIATPVEEPDATEPGLDPQVVFLGGLFVLAVLAVVYIAADILLPLVFAFTLKLLLQPAMRWLERLHVPRILAALSLIIGVFSTIVGLGAVISGPAGTWAGKLPEGIPRLQERLHFLRVPIDTLQTFLQTVEGYGGAKGASVAAAGGGSDLATVLFAGTENFARGFFTTVLFLFFLLASGDTFLRRLVEILPNMSNKRQAVDISRQIESDISAYLVTITIMNAAVGLLVALVMWFTGVGDPILWGAVAFLLNYVPIIGWLLGVVIFLLAGLLTSDTLWLAFLPAGLYFAIHLVEGETITPMLLAKRFTLNPVVVVIALVFWYWMWGVSGAIIAMPVLAVAKIVCDRIGPLAPLGRFLEG